MVDFNDLHLVGYVLLYRTIPPDYGLCVLNRKGLKNMVVFFDRNSQVIPQKPHLLFRQGPNEGSMCKCLKFIVKPVISS
jgi:hypothetical protein